MDSMQTMSGEHDFGNVFSDYFRTSTNLKSFETQPTCFSDVSDPGKNTFQQFLTADRQSGYHEFSETSGIDSALESTPNLLLNSSWSGDNYVLSHNNNLTVNLGQVHGSMSNSWDDENKIPDFASCSSSADSSMSYIPPGGIGSLDFDSFCGNNLSGNVTENSSLSSNNTPTHTSRRKRKSTPTQRVAANIRERRRMCSLNTSFDRLRRRVPVFPHEKKLSRIQTLRLAIRYISFMSDLMADDHLLLAELSRGRPNAPPVGIPAVGNPPGPQINHNNLDNQSAIQCNSQTNIVVVQNAPQSNEMWSKQCEMIPVRRMDADHLVDQATALPKMDISPPPAYNNTSTFIDGHCFDMSAMWQPFHNHSLDGGSYQSSAGMFIPAAEGISNNNHSLNEMFQSIDDAYDYF